MRSLSSTVTNAISAVAILLLGTVNLYKGSYLAGVLHGDPTLAALVGCGALVTATLLSRRLRIETSWWPLAVGLALFLPAVAVTSGASAYSIEKTSSLFLVTPVVVGAPMVLMRDGARRTWFVALAGLLGLSVSCWLILSGRAEPGSARISVGGANPIGLGLVACIGALVLGLGAWQRRGTVRLLCCAGFLVCAVAAVGTGSRGPLAAAAVAILLVRLRYMPSRSRLGLVLALAVVGVALVGVVSAVAPPAALARLTTAQGGETDQQRGRLLDESARIAWGHWGGVGWGDFGDYLSLSARVSAQGPRQYPHNVIAEAAAEGGVLALAGLGLLLVTSWRRLRAAASSRTGQTALALWVLAVGAAMTSSDLIGNRFMWCMIGFGLAVPPPLKARAKERRTAASRTRDLHSALR